MPFGDGGSATSSGESRLDDEVSPVMLLAIIIGSGGMPDAVGLVPALPPARSLPLAGLVGQAYY